MLIVTQTFVGHGFNMPNIGDLIDVPDHAVAAHLVSIGVAVEYETKVDPPPKVTKKKPLRSSRPGRAARKKTATKLRKSAKKS